MRHVSPRVRARHGLAVAVILAALAAACTPDQQPTTPLSPSAPRRTLGATVVVANANDAGPGSLRQAVVDASDGATIQFDPSLAGQTITLLTQLALTDKSVTIEGPAVGGITLSGAGADRVVFVDAGPIDAPIDVTLRNVTITNGRGTPAGGILLYGTLTLDHSTVSGNHVVGAPADALVGADGGGIGIYGGSLTLLNSTVSGNSALNSGGGVGFISAHGHSSGSATLINSTVTGNSGKSGGGILATVGTGLTESTAVTLYNSIVADNSSSVDVASINCFVGSNVDVQISGTNLSSDGSCGAASPAMIIGDPLIGPLAANGGPTMTHKLLAGSPAIDAAGCTVTDDQRYVTRPQGATCDIGAVEFDDYIRVAITLDPSGTVNSRTGVAIVSGSVSCSVPTPLALAVSINQAQKVGKVNVNVAASDVVQLSCGARKAWSIALTPPTGGFANSPALVTAATSNTSAAVVPASASATIKMAWSRK